MGAWGYGPLENDWAIELICHFKRELMKEKAYRDSPAFFVEEVVKYASETLADSGQFAALAWLMRKRKYRALVPQGFKDAVVRKIDAKVAELQRMAKAVRSCYMYMDVKTMDSSKREIDGYEEEACALYDFRHRIIHSIPLPPRKDAV